MWLTQLSIWSIYCEEIIYNISWYIIYRKPSNKSAVIPPTMPCCHFNKEQNTEALKIIWSRLFGSNFALVVYQITLKSHDIYMFHKKKIPFSGGWAKHSIHLLLLWPHVTFYTLSTQTQNQWVDSATLLKVIVRLMEQQRHFTWRECLK